MTNLDLGSGCDSRCLDALEAAARGLLAELPAIKATAAHCRNSASEIHHTAAVKDCLCCSLSYAAKILDTIAPQTIIALIAELRAPHKPDDGEAVTEDWLRTLGGNEGTAPAGEQFRFWDFVYDEFTVPDDGCRFTILFRIHSPMVNDGCMIDLHSKPDGGGVGLTKHWCKTRGDVRRLCAALGITLKD